MSEVQQLLVGQRKIRKTIEERFWLKVTKTPTAIKADR
jgi:hypothetical protein